MKQLILSRIETLLNLEPDYLEIKLSSYDHVIYYKIIPNPKYQACNHPTLVEKEEFLKFFTQDIRNGCFWINKEHAPNNFLMSQDIKGCKYQSF